MSNKKRLAGPLEGSCSFLHIAAYLWEDHKSLSVSTKFCETSQGTAVDARIPKAVLSHVFVVA